MVGIAIHLRLTLYILYKYNIIMGIRILLEFILLCLINMSLTIFYRRKTITHWKLYPYCRIYIFTGIRTLKLTKICNSEFFPNISYLLKLLATLPILTSTSAIIFSTMEILKHYLQNLSARSSTYVLLALQSKKCDRSFRKEKNTARLTISL